MPIITLEWIKRYNEGARAKPADLNNGGPASDPNPDNDNAPSSDLPSRGSDNQEKKTSKQKVDSMDDKSAKPKLDDMQWFMGNYDLEAEVDPQTGLAKWPLSFKRIEKDTKRPNKVVTPTSTKRPDGKSEQPPTAV